MTACAWCHQPLEDHRDRDLALCLAALSGDDYALHAYQPDDLRAQYQAGMLTMGHKPGRDCYLLRVDMCAHCGCRKMGWGGEPNAVDDWCATTVCPCHDDPDAVDVNEPLARAYERTIRQRLGGTGP